LQTGAKIDFTLEPSGLLMGKIDWSNRPPSFVELHRLPTTNVPAILEAAKKTVFDWEEIRIPVHSQVGPTKGQTSGLQTTIFPQTSTGRHPVVIWNHGSSGSGPTNLVYRGDNATMFFHSLGYIVIAPMRKGRGSSDGPNLEEDHTVSPTVQLDSAIEDLQAVVNYASRRDDVDPGKIIVAGVSRGGFLSVAYAGRYPTNVAGVVNFSGGWFAERTPHADFNSETFGKSGHDAKVPMLWLYADHDSYYSLKFDESEFSKFRDAGGRGELVEVRDIPGDGHMLCLWVDHWRDKVTNYLNGLPGRN
jgi:dienelactone hydrolase